MATPTFVADAPNPPLYLGDRGGELPRPEVEPVGRAPDVSAIRPPITRTGRATRRFGSTYNYDGGFVNSGPIPKLAETFRRFRWRHAR